jgi:L-lactate utilization protein LutC
LRQCQQLRDGIESRNVKHRLDKLLRETMRSIDRAENVIHHAIDINDLTKGRIWFEDHEYKSEEAKQSYDEILELVRQWSCDISLGYDADHHEQLSKKIGKSAEEYAAGRVTIQTSTGKHIINYSRTAPK